MKKIALAIVLICIGMGVANAQSSQKAKSLLDEVYNKVKSYNNIYIDFKYELDNKAEGIHQETKGNVTLDGDKYVFNYLGATKIFDGSKIYTIIPDNEEVTIESKNAEDEGTITPSKMLTFYKDGYNYAWKESKTIKGRSIQLIELTPISSSAEVKSLLLGIDTQTKHIYNLVENGANGTSTTITVMNMKTNQTLPKGTFAFDRDKYQKQGYYIID
ncbi:Outer membrane lipoprotein-sorting protein [Pustulibacterium marinum]|uniref:Outer membrane lipoprotein-sorting protein n=1 Tax=Pustulibacterium marinum TaxID=1224947 RepID=A0A1I7INH4_9FLAO|nr:outer membrane lipoprotein carrier protein LolA [Pustulibacterium marinum]SFU74448.1 Outer membrane lipoprotein-sorting protein [Pustulibacterium marinum]